MKCVLCDNNTFTVLTNKLRNNIRRRVVKCTKCSLVSLENPSQSTINYSTLEYRKKHSPVIGKTVTAKEMYNIQIQFQQNRLNRINHLINSKSIILEIGCSTGHFLKSIEKKVSKVIGIELDPRHARFAREHCKLEVYEQSLGRVPIQKCQFDVIFMFQVFEHIQNPLEFLDMCRKYLKPSGKIYLEVPNINDVLLSLYGIPSFKEFYYRAPHIYYYSEKTLKHMLHKAGFIGSTHTIQEYTLFNHIHWLLTGKPQPSQIDGYNSPKWSYPNSSMKKENKILLNWFDKVNKQYTKLLEQKGLAEHVCYTGKMI